jgi:hypothetical protein
MKDNLTEVVLIRDDSNLFFGDKQDWTASVKHFFAAQESEGVQLHCTLKLLGGRLKTAFENQPLKKIRLRKEIISAAGACPLLDSLSDVIFSVGQRYNDTPEEERPSQVVFAVSSFRRDNASHINTYQNLKDRIAHQRDVYSWSFFLHTNQPDLPEKLGIADENCLITETEDNDAELFGEPFAESVERFTELVRNRLGCQIGE